MDFENIYQKIRQLRIERGLSQKALGEKCGLPQQAINRIEQGQRKIDIDLLFKIATALKTDISEFLGNERFPFEPDIRETYINFDNKERHHLLIHHYDEMGRVGRNSLMEILASLKRLNQTGQQEAAKRVEELTELPRYTKPDEPPQE